MKGISIRQPYASALMIGAKRYETRSWRTHYRGPILIHASLRHGPEFFDLLRMLRGIDHRPANMPFQAIIAQAELVACRPVEVFAADELDEVRAHGVHTWRERDLGDFSPGRYAWIFENIRPVKPVTFRAQQGLFDVPADIVRALTF